MSNEDDQPNVSLRELIKLVWRCWPYYRPQLRHIVAVILLNSFIGVVYVGGIFVGNDLVENKILLGERLQAMQATALFVGEEYVTTGADEETLLTDEQRQRVALGVLVAGAIVWVILSAYVAAVWYYMVWIYQSINQDLRVEMLSRAEHLSLQYHSHSRTGDAIYRVYQDSATITNILQYAVLTPLRVAAWLAFGALVLVFFSPWFVPIILVASTLIYLMMRRLLPVVREKARLAREHNSDLTSRIQENLAAIRVIKANAAEDRMMAKFERDSQRALDAAYEMRKTMSVLMLGTILVAFIAFTVAEYFMATWAMTEKTTFLGGTIALVSFATWNLGAYKTASHQGEESALGAFELAYILCIVQDLTIGLKRAFYLLDLEPGVKDPDQSTKFPPRLERVRFQNVAFGYEPGRPVLRGINLEARPGTITAIVGGTGAGKSTLMSLLLRLYDTEQGGISINDVNLRDFSIADLRANIAIALQQNVLFAQSIADNIRYGQDDIDDAFVKRAAEVACADEFIAAMPDGYATELGERGGKLSTGQRQRLSIARAVLRDTPVLILDEPTASLDAETEQRVIRNLAEWGKERVVFIITHRLSTIRNADQIAYLEDGEIRELGGHDALIAAQGAYASFVMAESGISSGGDAGG